MDAPTLVSSPAPSDEAAVKVPETDAALRPAGGLHMLRPEKPDRIPIQEMGVRSSVLKRIFRGSARFLCAVLIGVCGTLAWQSYGDQMTDFARSQLRLHAPSLAELLPVSTSKSVAPVAAAAADQQPKPADPATELRPKSGLDAAELQQQLQPMLSDLAAAKQAVEQLAIKQDQFARTQDQMEQTIAKLQAAEQSLSQKLSAAPAHKPVVRTPPPRPLQRPSPASANVSSRPLLVLPER